MSVRNTFRISVRVNCATSVLPGGCIAELNEKLMVGSHQIEQMKEEISSKDTLLHFFEIRDFSDFQFFGKIQNFHILSEVSD